MRVRKLLPLRTVALIVAAILTLAAAGCSRQAEQCPLCERGECANLSFTIERKDGGSIRTCCPRCGLHALAPATTPSATADASKVPWDQVRSLTVRDFETAQLLSAEAAAYVEGSDVTPCSMHSEAPRDERGCCLKPVYDRCLPSLLAFHSRKRAEAFAKENGGAVRSFADLKASVTAAAAPQRPS